MLSLFISQKTKFVKTVVVLILVLMLCLMIYSSWGDSATMDELAHIPAGYSYLVLADYRLNPEHPPLLKSLSALPLAFMNLNFPTEVSAWKDYVNGQWDMGRIFLYESGNDADKIIFWARIAPILLTLLLALFIFKWSKEFLGAGWALLVLILFALNPTVLAHGHYVTTDIAATFGFVIAIYYFLKFLQKPDRRNIILAGISFGIAQLLKFSTALLVPYFFLVFIAFLIYRKWKNNLLDFGGYLGGFILIFLIGCLIIYLPYLHHTWNYPAEKQFSDSELILTSFGKGADPQWRTCKTWVGDLGRQIRCLANIQLWMVRQPLLKPLAHYFLGLLMAVQRSAFGHTTYFLGEVSAAGWWYYFPIIFLLKEPIPLLIIIFMAIFLALRSILKKWRARPSSFISCSLPLSSSSSSQNGLIYYSLLFFIGFYWLYSIQSPLNIGIRHILPTVPLIYLLSIAQIKQWMKPKIPTEILSLGGRLISLFWQAGRLILKTIFLSILIIWLAIECLWISPHFISYFNEFIGGPKNGYIYVVNSNYDWGQDLKRLKKFVEEQGIEKIAIDYFGGDSPSYRLGEKYIPWQAAKGPYQGWFAVSSTFLQGSLGKLAPGQPRRPEDEYRWLEGIEPTARAGYSIFIYKLAE